MYICITNLITQYISLTVLHKTSYSWNFNFAEHDLIEMHDFLKFKYNNILLNRK